MPKQKTHKASSKVFKKRPNGTLKYKLGNGNHKTNKDSSKQVRQRRNSGTLAHAEAQRIKKVI